MYGNNTKYNDFGSNNRNNEEDDLYEGFNYSIDVNPVPQTGFNPTGYQPAAGSLASGRPPQSSLGGRMMTGAGGPPMSRMMTGQGGGSEARPMTSVSGAGFTSKGATQKTFDPMGVANRGPAPALAVKSDNSPEDMAKEMEKQVNGLIEKSADAAVKNDLTDALERAKEAGKKERQLCKHREQHVQ